MRIALCNEVIAPMPLPQQCHYAAKLGYAGDIAVEPLDYVPDGPGAAARAIGYIQGILEAPQER